MASGVAEVTNASSKKPDAVGRATAIIFVHEISFPTLPRASRPLAVSDVGGPFAASATGGQSITQTTTVTEIPCNSAPTMRVQHTAFPLPNFPVYSSAFVSDDELVIGGGGGQSKSGIKNKIVRCLLSPSSRTYLRLL